MIAIIPLIFILIGALAYGLSSNGKVQELGRITFAAGVFALAFSLASHTVKLF